ncbi:MAG TPA: ABC-F family ATP-binding cassette domain-containing protein [Solirubrobacteraceae bacterium]|nr:ABC-F family ATP-binding cassette domain-containing protein [Solirubrobacteraceae bacterium]
MLQASDLGKAYDGAPLFDGLSFVLGDGERAGLVGPNGVGKSTLVRLLAGADRPDRGAAATGRGDRIGWLPQEAPDATRSLGDLLGAGLGEVWRVRGELHALEAALARGDTSVLDAYGRAQERFAALGGWALEATLDEARRALAIDHLDPDTPLARLSGGEQARALLAGTLLAGPTVLLLDEPTNHLDGDGLAWLEGWLQGFDGTVLVVSHDRAFLDAVVGCILELEPGGALTRYEGGYSAYRAERERRRERQALEYEAQQKRRRRLEADVAMTRRQAQHTERTVSRAAAPQLKRKAKKVAKKAKARETRLRREFEGGRAVARPAERPSLRLRLEAHGRGRRRVAALRGVRSRGLRDVDLDLHRGDRVAVTGPNGAGKTTLLNVLAGVLVPAAGTAELAAGARMLPQTPLRLPSDERAVDWLRAQAAMDEGAARMLLGAFGLDSVVVHRALGRLSPGERARVHMAAMVASGAELLLLDEPTNHLDPETLEAVERALRTFDGTIVAVSHDRAFLDGIGVTRRLEVRDGGVVER